MKHNGLTYNILNPKTGEPSGSIRVYVDSGKLYFIADGDVDQLKRDLPYITIQVLNALFDNGEEEE